MPALNSWMERPIEPDFFTRTRELAAYTQPLVSTPTSGTSQPDLISRQVITGAHSLGDPETLALMRQLGVTHVYSGATGGASKPRLDIVAMRKDPGYYKLVYFRDGVYIFEVVY